MHTPFTTTFFVQKSSFFVSQKLNLKFLSRFLAKKRIKNTFRKLKRNTFRFPLTFWVQALAKRYKRV